MNYIMLFSEELFFIIKSVVFSDCPPPSNLSTWQAKCPLTHPTILLFKTQWLLWEAHWVSIATRRPAQDPNYFQCSIGGNQHDMGGAEIQKIPGKNWSVRVQCLQWNWRPSALFRWCPPFSSGFEMDVDMPVEKKMPYSFNRNFHAMKSFYCPFPHIKTLRGKNILSPGNPASKKCLAILISCTYLRRPYVVSRSCLTKK